MNEWMDEYGRVAAGGIEIESGIMAIRTARASDNWYWN